MRMLIHIQLYTVIKLLIAKTEFFKLLRHLPIEEIEQMAASQPNIEWIKAKILGGGMTHNISQGKGNRRWV